jgi:hypothetical protein
MKLTLFLILYLILTFAGPLFLIVTNKIDFTADYRTANRESAHIAPDPRTTKEAVIQVYSARAFNWRGAFSVHAWIAVKPKNADSFTVFQFIGWRLLRQLPPLMISQDVPDRLWFDQRPSIILDIRGREAENLIPKIKSAAAAYPYANEYTVWPGPNSNTFIAWVARHVPEMHLALPSNAVGKDYQPISQLFSIAPSGTGYQFSLYGLFGVMIARKEGLEINLLGLTYGFSPATLTIKLPGIGDIARSSPD